MCSKRLEGSLLVNRWFGCRVRETADGEIKKSGWILNRGGGWRRALFTEQRTAEETTWWANRWAKYSLWRTGYGKPRVSRRQWGLRGEASAEDMNVRVNADC